MVTKLDGIILNVKKDDYKAPPQIKRNPLAGSSKHSIHKLGIKNLTWTLDCWTYDPNDIVLLEQAEMKQCIEFEDKDGNKFDVTISGLSVTRFAHAKRIVKIMLEEYF